LRSALTVMVFLFVALMLLFMPGMGFLGVAAVFGGGALFLLFAFHYFVWGRLMNMAIQEAEEAQPEDDKPNADRSL
jgi:hypothetical protein